jgi:hypothetical protein
VPITFATHYQRLEGQVGQIVTIFPFSTDPKKIAFLNIHNGVCHAVLIDKHVPGDEFLDSLVDLVDSDDDSE